eukprot:11156314-Lingulodinium_polyedra.AAC.1
MVMSEVRSGVCGGIRRAPSHSHNHTIHSIASHYLYFPQDVSQVRCVDEMMCVTVFIHLRHTIRTVHASPSIETDGD